MALAVRQRRRKWIGAAAATIAGFFAAERERWVLWLPVALAGGILAYFAVLAEPANWIGAAVAAAGCALLLAAGRHAWGGAAALCLLGFGLGFGAAQLRTHLVAAPVLAKPVFAEIGGTVEAVERRDGRLRAVIRVVSFSALGAGERPVKVRVTLLPGEAPPVPGSTVRLAARLRPPPPPVTPAAYDFQRALYFERIGATGFAVRPLESTADSTNGNWIERLRADLSARVRAVIPGPAGEIAAALLVGDRFGIDEATEAAMRDSGLAHLISISGLHMSLVAGCVFVAVRTGLAAIERAALLLPIKSIAAVAAVLFASLYLLLSGAAIPAQRAYLMTAAVFLAAMLGRRAISMRLVAVAAVGVLLVAPETLLSASFQMSFAAVVALVAAYECEAVRRACSGGRSHAVRFLKSVLMLVLTSLVAGAATAPYSLYHFNHVALYGVLANMAAVPLTGIWIMPWGVASLLLAPLGLERIALVPMGWGIEAVLWVASLVADLPGSVAGAPSMPGPLLAAISLAGLWLCIWRTRWRIAGAPVVAAAMAAAFLGFWRPPDILISDRGRLVGVMTESGGLAVSRTERETFAQKVWRRRAGLEEEGAGDGRFRCDAVGCSFPLKGAVLAVSETAESHEEDCRLSDILITAIPVRIACSRPRLVLGPRELKREGAHAIWFDDGRLRVLSVADSRGIRPWSGAGVRF